MGLVSLGYLKIVCMPYLHRFSYHLSKMIKLIRECVVSQSELYAYFSETD